MSRRQERARLRNWQKARLISFRLDESVLTEEEKELHRLIMQHKKTLLDFWDSETEVFKEYNKDKVEKPQIGG